MQSLKYITIASVRLVIFFSGVILLIGCGELLDKKTEIVTGITSDTVWGRAQSPYFLRGDILIPAQTTLTIEPGVVVMFSGNNKLKIEGTLIANGAASAPIIFRQAGKYYISGYYGLVFANKYSGKKSMISHCLITQARFAIYCDGDSPDISYCIITGNNVGVHLWNSNAVISHNRISDNIEHGVYIGSMQPTVTDNRIIHNGSGIICAYAPNPVIRNNDIYGNRAYDFVLAKTESDIIAINNWWGSTDEMFIRKKIFDKQHDGSLGNVMIIPLSQSCFHPE
ncbi:MAG: right-handed parallel beta-helix repeat-containing protein [bacterium]|nr:right-handed parallel beta-helix repeat-containing protein [bacterium]